MSTHTRQVSHETSLTPDLLSDHIKLHFSKWKQFTLENINFVAHIKWPSLKRLPLENNNQKSKIKYVSYYLFYGQLFIFKNI